MSLRMWFVVMIAIAGCAQHMGDSGADVSVTGEPGFAFLEANLFSKCAGCHGSGYSTYQGVMSSGITPGNPSGSSLYNTVSSGFMPPGGESQAVVQDLSAWIQNGAQDN